MNTRTHSDQRLPNAKKIFTLGRSTPAPALALAPGTDKALPARSAWPRRIVLTSLGVLVVAITVWFLASASSHTYRMPADAATLSTVKRATFQDFIAVRATAAPFATNYLTADQGGTVKQVLAEDGTVVHAGEPVVILTNAALQLQVASREADTASQINALENTKLQLEETRFRYQHDLLDIDHQISRLKSDLTRDKILLDGHAVAPATYAAEQDEYAYEMKLRDATVESRDTEQRVRASQVTQLGETLTRLNDNFAIAKASLDALTIRAPSDGQLTALDAEIGQSKPQGAVLGQVDSLDRFKLTAQIDEFYLSRVALHQAALFTIDGRSLRATVAKIYPQIAKGSFRIDLNIANDALQGMRTGQAVDLKLELGGTTQALVLPNGPFYQDTGGRWVFVLDADGKSGVRRNVRLGRRNPDYVEVLDGLAPGDRVVTSGYQAYQQVDRIEFTKAAPHT